MAVDVKPFTLRSLRRKSFSREKLRSTADSMRFRVLLFRAFHPYVSGFWVCGALGCRGFWMSP